MLMPARRWLGYVHLSSMRIILKIKMAANKKEAGCKCFSEPDMN